MKLRIRGDGSQPGRISVELVDNDETQTAVELRTVTRLEVDADRGARLTLYVPELDVEIAIPDAMANALLDLEARLRKLADLRGEEVARLANELGETKAERDKYRRTVAALEEQNRALVAERVARPL